MHHLYTITADLHAPPLRQDDLRLAVRGGDALRGAAGRDQHLLDVQAHLAEAAAQRAEVLHAAAGPGPGLEGLPRDPPEHGGGRHGRPGRRGGRARGELVSEQGGRSLYSTCFDVFCYALYCFVLNCLELLCLLYTI